MGLNNLSVYLSACFERQRDMKVKREEVSKLGVTVVSRWIDEGEAETRTQLIAWRDLCDVQDATILILFTEPSPCRSGGKHVEMGIAYGLNKEIILVGPKTNVFHYLPGILQFSTWEEARLYLAIRSGNG